MESIWGLKFGTLNSRVLSDKWGVGGVGGAPIHRVTRR